MDYRRFYTLLALIPILILCISGQASAQSLSLFDIDTSGFPTMKAKFWAFDANDNQTRPEINQLSIKENGLIRTITNINCPAPAAPVIALSSVLVIDISGSMSTESGSTTRMDIAKSAAYSWIGRLALTSNECAITSFDGTGYLNQDFTNSWIKLSEAIASLKPQGGTDFDAALINPMAGGLSVSKYGKYKKVIVLLTDGQAATPRIKDIIREANRQDCSIYCITLCMNTPESLKEIALQTGGQYFDNITTALEARNVYRQIMHRAQGEIPCSIEWTSNNCISAATQLVLDCQGITAYRAYTPPIRPQASLGISPIFVSFGNKIPNLSYDTTITLTAKNTSLTVTGVNKTSGSADFTIVNTSFPLLIPQNTSQQITLRFMPQDSAKHYASFEITTDQCPGFFSTNGGIRDNQSPASTLKLIRPNGGETYVIGSDTMITWQGIAPTDTVHLELSTDNGTSWKTITDKATGLSYAWHTSMPPGAQCLIRISQNDKGNSIGNNQEVKTLTGHNHYVNALAIRADGSQLATASYDKTAKIWDVNTGTVIRTLYGHTDFVWGIAYSPDGKKIITGSYDNTANIWDANTGRLIHTLLWHQQGIWCVAFSPDGNRVLVGSWDGTATLWDANTGSRIRVLAGHNGIVYSAIFSPDMKQIVTCSADKTVKIWDANTGVLIRTLIGHTSRVSGACYKPGDNNILTTSGMDRTAITWDITTGMPLRTMSGHQDWLNGLCYSPDGNSIATASMDRTAIVWDANTGIAMRTLKGHAGSVASIAYSPDGNTIATASWDSTVKLWNMGAGALQEDKSDAVFSIVAPQAAARDIDLGQIQNGKYKDSVIVDFIQNKGNHPFTVKSISFRGTDAAAFSLISGTPPYSIAPGQHTWGEFRFRPGRIGLHTAEIVIITQADTLIQKIYGYGSVSLLAIINPLFDFGNVSIGTSHDSISAITIWNTGTAPLTITTKHDTPNAIDFTTVKGGGNFTLAPGDTARLDLRFKPSDVGRTSGRLLFEYNGPGSPAVIQLFGQGITNATGLSENRGALPTGAKTSLVCRPNPVRDMLRIEYGLIEELPVTIQVVDMQGRVRLIPVQINAQSAGIHTITTDISTLGAGVYYVRMIIPTGTLTNRLDIIP
jgi:WD40 repeat protein/uncharacterized protein YegL